LRTLEKKFKEKFERLIGPKFLQEDALFNFGMKAIELEDQLKGI